GFGGGVDQDGVVTPSSSSSRSRLGPAGAVAAAVFSSWASAKSPKPSGAALALAANFFSGLPLFVGVSSENWTARMSPATGKLRSPLVALRIASETGPIIQPLTWMARDPVSSDAGFSTASWWVGVFV